ncbi:MAG: 50S ribosomal protein L25 [bacterium]|nr:50S ribosomal protein L25 [bacterium]
MLKYDLQVEKREKTNRHGLRTLRNSEMIPCVAYGHNETNRIFSISALELTKMFNAMGREKALLNVSAGDDKFTAVIKEIKRSPRTNKIIHMDFQIIHMDEKIKVDVPVILKGSAIGVKDGGILEQILRNIELKCLPANIPSHIEIDITNFKVGDSTHVKDIKVEGAEILTHAEEVIVVILAPKAVVEEAPKPAEEEAKEPEVITEKKPTEEEAAEAAKGKDEKKKEKK